MNEESTFLKFLLLSLPDIFSFRTRIMYCLWVMPYSSWGLLLLKPGALPHPDCLVYFVPPALSPTPLAYPALSHPSSCLSCPVTHPSCLSCPVTHPSCLSCPVTHPSCLAPVISHCTCLTVPVLVMLPPISNRVGNSLFRTHVLNIFSLIQ